MSDRYDVEMRGVRKLYGTVVALHNIDLAVRKGEFFSLLGPSGCGKTTTLSLLAGFEQPSSGEILIGGQDATRQPAYQRNVCTVFQSYALFPHLTVAENVAFGLRFKHVSGAERDRLVDEMLHICEIRRLARRYPAQLSGGEQQRVALARALVLRPAVVLLDEPLGALDLQLRKRMQLELKRLQRSLGITFIYVTHDQEEALAMSDRLAVMEYGHIQQMGTPEELYERPRSRFVARFLGFANVVEGQCIDSQREGSEYTVLVAVGPDRVAGRSRRGACPGEPVALSVRTERITLHQGGGGHSGAGGLKGRLETTVYTGGAVQYHVRLPGGTEVVALVPAATARRLTAREGDEITVLFQADDAWHLDEETPQ